MAHDFGVIVADGIDWMYYGIGNECWGMNKRTGKISKLRHGPYTMYPRKVWTAGRFSQVPLEIQLEYLLWKMSL